MLFEDIPIGHVFQINFTNGMVCQYLKIKKVLITQGWSGYTGWYNCIRLDMEDRPIQYKATLYPNNFGHHDSLICLGRLGKTKMNGIYA